MVVEPERKSKEVRYKYVRTNQASQSQPTNNKTNNTELTLFRIGLAINGIVVPFSPFVPHPSSFDHSEETRTWILTKCKLSLYLPPTNRL